MRVFRILIAVAVVVTTVLPLNADNTKPARTGPSSSARLRPLKGTVSEVDQANSSFKLNVAGKEILLRWNEKTKMAADPVDGDNVEVFYVSENGQSIAQSIKLLQ